MSENLLEIRNLHYQIGRKTLFENINLVVQNGQTVVITGQSGIGKSTLLKIIALLEIPQKGDIFFKGKSIVDMSPYLYRREVSYCYQTPQLFGDKVLENVMFPFEIRQKKYIEEPVIEYLNTFQLDKSILQKEVKVLSGGERQRIALIRNLLFLPKILLLDEITSNLDQVNKHIVLSAMEQITIRNNIASIIVTHDSVDSYPFRDSLYIMINKSMERYK